MRALAALLVLLPSFVLAARVFNDPLDLRAVARQALENDVPRVPPEFNINSGGPEVGRFVTDPPEWIRGDTTVFVDDDAIVGGAEEKNLPMYSSHRFGTDGATWGYDIPVMEPGVYGCTAHFAELDFESFGVGNRVFNLHFATANGDVRDFENIDVFAELDEAEFTVLTKTAVDLVVTGILSIRLKPLAGNSMLSGLTCERTGDLPPGVEPDFETDPRVPTAPVTETKSDESMTEGVAVSGTEVNINCGGEAIGRFSAEDYSWIRGGTDMWEGPPGVDIGGAEEKNAPAVKSHRYGQDGSDWGYVIPLENPGIYDCSLHFSETDSQSFAVGARVFDIMIMDKMLKDVDVYRDAGDAPFTAVVKTFTGLAIPKDLLMAFKAKKGNAFVSAITCEKTGVLRTPSETQDAVTESPDGVTTEEPSPAAIDPSLAPTPGSLVESPIPTPASMIPTIQTPETQTPETQTPETQTPGMEMPEPTPVASVPSTIEDLDETPSTPTLSTGEIDPEETPSETDQPDVTIDDPLIAGDGSVIQQYELEAVVTDGVFTDEVKDALTAISVEAIDFESEFAMTGITLSPTSRMTIFRQIWSSVMRQDGTKNIYQLILQGRHSLDDERQSVQQYSEFIEEGTVNEKLAERDVQNVEIRWIGTRALSTQPTESNTSNTAKVVGIVVGCVLGALVLVALIAFFVVKNKRNNEPDTAAFDAPPPAMSESEVSSVRERSETGASVEYLDDDSTFTAATSRAGDHVDQVGFVKDVFGRGTADGAHGSS